MTDTYTAGEQVQEEILKTVRNGQSAVVAAIQAWARTVESITPALPDVNVPFAEKLPKPQELIASAYDFAEQLLASQRKFAEDVLKTTLPMLTGEDDAPARKNGSTAKKPQGARRPMHGSPRDRGACDIKRQPASAGKMILHSHDWSARP